LGILYITEYAQLAPAGAPGGWGQVPQEPPLAEQKITYSASVQSAAFNAKTRMVRIHTDSICSIEIGTNPTATTSTGRMVAGQTEYHGVPIGAGYMVAAITNT